MACGCGSTSNSNSITATTSNSGSSSSDSMSGKKICNRCLFFWVAVGIAVLFLLKRS